MKQSPFLTQPLEFYSIINEPKINVTNFAVILDNFHETRQLNKTFITNLSMLEIKKIKVKTINPVIGTHNFMISAYKFVDVFLNFFRFSEF